MAHGFNAPGVVRPFGIFSSAAWQPPGRVLHLSGQVSQAEDGSLVGAGDIIAQTRQVLTNIRGVLASVGGTMADIEKVTIFVTGMTRLMEIHAVRAEFFSQPYPASTLVQVSALVHPEYLIEIEAVAVIPEERAKEPAYPPVPLP
jgi:enamine deaminase RidA (YjgF/YER057c/UK114 family)